MKQSMVEAGHYETLQNLWMSHHEQLFLEIKLLRVACFFCSVKKLGSLVNAEIAKEK